MIFLLIGCGKEEVKLEETADLAQDEVKETEVQEEDVAVGEAGQKEELEVREDEVEEQEETSDEMAEAQITTTVNEAGSISDYMESLDPQKPAIVIYNPDDGTIINMKEGEHYSLNKEDQIIVNRNWDFIESRKFDTNLVFNEFTELCDSAIILYLNYDNFVKNQEFYYEIWLTDNPNEDSLKLTCYLDPPIE